MFIYPRWNIDPAVWWQSLFPAASLAVTIALWLVRKKWRAPLAGWLFFVGTLFPVLGFCNVFPFFFSFVADHFQYLASLGIIVPAAAGLVLAAQRIREMQAAAVRRRRVQWVAGTLGGCLVAGLAVVAHAQCRMYSDGFTLYRTTIEKNPTCWLAYNNLGVELFNSGQPQQALDYLQLVVKIKPDYAQGLNSLGLTYAALNELGIAENYYRRAIALAPSNAEFRDNLGIVLGRSGKLAEATDEFRTALSIRPNYVKPHVNLGRVLLETQRPQQALEHLDFALTLQPDCLLAQVFASMAYAQLGQTDEAIAAGEKALELAVAQHQLAMAQKIAQWLTNYRVDKDKHPDGMPNSALSE
jgi:tetratricopeptide (TPR) repeat protein